MTMFVLGVAAVPAGALALTLTWWLIGRVIGLLRFPILGLVTMRRPEPLIALLERSRGTRAFRFSVPGLVVLVFADRRDPKDEAR